MIHAISSPSHRPDRDPRNAAILIMGGYGSGGRGGGPTVESAFRIDIDALRRHGLIRLGGRGGCVIRFSGPYYDLDVECETHIDGPWNSWVRLKYSTTDYWTDEPLEIDDKILLATSRPPFGGLRWWFVCPHLNRRVASCAARAMRWRRCVTGGQSAAVQEAVFAERFVNPLLRI
jgi:hypothetical protein